MWRGGGVGEERIHHSGYLAHLLDVKISQRAKATAAVKLEKI